jgi:4-hydroxy-tetrahydrodipicolinate synthase
MFEDLKTRLIGSFYTIFTPFLEDESIDFENLEKYITILYRQGARRFYAMAYNSRYGQLSDAEIFELNAFCVNVVKDLDETNIVIVGDPIHGSTRNSIDFANHAKQHGADLVSLIMQEKFFGDAQVLEHYSQIGEATNMPILVHEMPFLSGFDGKQMHWPPSLLTSLKKIPQIAALKEDGKDFELTRKALELEPDIRVIIAGSKKKLMQFRPHGALAYLNGISIIDAGIGETFWQAFQDNDEATIDFILEKLEKPFFDKCVGKYGWHRTNKALLQAAGYMHRRDRMPLNHLSDDEFIEVQNVYHEVSQNWNLLRADAK